MRGLVRDFPNLFPGQAIDPKNPVDVVFHFECGDGWEPLIRRLAEQIAPLLPPGAHAVQVKEKFGSLRFYVDGVPWAQDSAIYSAIAEAEEKSGRICETCGAPGLRRTRGRYWIRTLCPEHEGEAARKEENP